MSDYKRTPLISFMLSVFNGENYLEQSIYSILQQTIDDFELLIIDDGSTDRSVDIIKDMMDYRFRLIRNQKNQGLTKNLNRLLFEANGHFLARMDADDISTSDRICRQVDEMLGNQDIAVCGGNFISICLNQEKFVNLLSNHDSIISSFSFF